MRAMLVLAEAPRDTWVKTESIADQQHLPRKFLEAILSELRRARLVESMRGADGGYRLARPASKIFVADVMRAVDGPLAEVRGLRPETLVYEGSAERLAGRLGRRPGRPAGRARAHQRRRRVGRADAGVGAHDDPRPRSLGPPLTPAPPPPSARPRHAARPAPAARPPPSPPRGPEGAFRGRIVGFRQPEAGEAAAGQTAPPTPHPWAAKSGPICPICGTVRGAKCASMTLPRGNASPIFRRQIERTCSTPRTAEREVSRERAPLRSAPCPAGAHGRLLHRRHRRRAGRPDLDRPSRQREHGRRISGLRRRRIASAHTRRPETRAESPSRSRARPSADSSAAAVQLPDVRPGDLATTDGAISKTGSAPNAATNTVAALADDHWHRLPTAPIRPREDRRRVDRHRDARLGRRNRHPARPTGRGRRRSTTRRPSLDDAAGRAADRPHRTRPRPGPVASCSSGAATTGLGSTPSRAVRRSALRPGNRKRGAGRSTSPPEANRPGARARRPGLRHRRPSGGHDLDQQGFATLPATTRRPTGGRRFPTRHRPGHQVQDQIAAVVDGGIDRRGSCGRTPRRCRPTATRPPSGIDALRYDPATGSLDVPASRSTRRTSRQPGRRERRDLDRRPILVCPASQRLVRRLRGGPFNPHAHGYRVDPTRAWTPIPQGPADDDNASYLWTSAGAARLRQQRLPRGAQTASPLPVAPPHGTQPPTAGRRCRTSPLAGDQVRCLDRCAAARVGRDVRRRPRCRRGDVPVAHSAGLSFGP